MKTKHISMCQECAAACSDFFSVQSVTLRLQALAAGVAEAVFSQPPIARSQTRTFGHRSKTDPCQPLERLLIKTKLRLRLWWR